MKVLVCGGRDYYDWKQLDEVLSSYKITHLIHGNACGADWLAKAWAHWKSIPQTSYLADWQKYGRSAGMMRNQKMLDHGKPRLVVAFKGGYGTKGMVKLAEKAKVKIVKVPYIKPYDETRSEHEW